MVYLNPRPEAGQQFFLDFQGRGAFYMLNLLKYNPIARYDGEAEPSQTSGAQAYEMYLNLISPFLNKIGSEIAFHGSCSPFLVGPDSEKWDEVLLVKHASVEAFVGLSQNPEFLKVSVHQKAALADFRLLPIRS